MHFVAREWNDRYQSITAGSAAGCGQNSNDIDIARCCNSVEADARVRALDHGAMSLSGEYTRFGPGGEPITSRVIGREAATRGLCKSAMSPTTTLNGVPMVPVE